MYLRSVAAISSIIVSSVLSLGTTSQARRATDASSLADVNCRGLSASLRPGVVPLANSSPGVSGNTPADMPPLTVAVLAPLYPHSVTTTRTPAAPEEGLPATPYLETADAHYVAAASVSSLSSWEQLAFPTCGYSLFTNGSGRNGKSPTDYYFEFQSVSTPNISIQLTIQAETPHSSLVLYFIHAVSLPPRPGSTGISQNEKSVKIRYIFSGGRREWTITIANHPTNNHLLVNPVTNLMAEVGASQTMDLIEHSCFSGSLASATLIFTAVTGQKVTVVVVPRCRDFRVNNSRWIADPETALWNTVGLTVYRYCMGHPCKMSPVQNAGDAR